MIVRLTQLDGKLPNLALMALAHHHKTRGDEIRFYRSPYRHLGEPRYDRVYGSAIFKFSNGQIDRLAREFPGAVIGGTGTESTVTVEDAGADSAGVDYSPYPDFKASIGFTQRGCRLKCGFCVVPKKEGAPRSVNTIGEIWRGKPWPKNLHLLDNDFFGQPREQWEARIAEIRDGKFKVCLNQGINIRMIGPDEARALASVRYYDDQFETRRLYTAWDNIGDEARFFAGVNRLRDAGIPPTHLLVFMLVGYDKRETWGRVMYRFEKMTALGIRPYPMVFGDRLKTLPLGDSNQPIQPSRTLMEFQRWVIRKAYTFIPFWQYNINAKGRRETETADLFAGSKQPFPAKGEG